jgi:3-isopropylmalate dehydrogenase
MMLRFSFGLSKEADAIEAAVNRVLDAGYRTADINGDSPDAPLSCTGMTSKIAEALAEAAEK